MFKSIAERFADCNCQVDTKAWLAQVYQLAYIASGAALDKPLGY